MRPIVRAILLAGAVTIWLIALGAGFTRLWSYESAAGAAANAPATRPTEASVIGNSGKASLVMLMHPQCPCSRASVEELAKLMAQCDGKLTATLFMLRPLGKEERWAQSTLWKSAAAIPGVRVIADPSGEAAKRFGADTSGQALLYSADGKLLFAGGITGARAHMGDNEGRALVTALARGQVNATTQPASTPVFGCPLFSSADGSK